MSIIHEIPFPEDKAMQYFLWVDYFHDSNISNIEFNRNGRCEHQFPNRIELTIVSIRDIDNDKHIPDNRRDANKYIQEHKNKYVYKLVFEDCKYVASERLFSCNDYIHGAFKDTSMLRIIQYEADLHHTGKMYYHFRIAFDDGYLDLIFSKFHIRKLTGKIKYPDFVPISNYPKYYLEHVNNGGLLAKDGNLNLDAIQELIETSNDDEARCCALMYLVMNEGLMMIESARKMTELDCLEFSETYDAAIRVIGLQGDESDLPLLFNEYLSIEKRFTSNNILLCSTLLSKRLIMDSIELIKSRAAMQH